MSSKKINYFPLCCCSMGHDEFILQSTMYESSSWPDQSFVQLRCNNTCVENGRLQTNHWCTGFFNYNSADKNIASLEFHQNWKMLMDTALMRQN